MRLAIVAIVFLAGVSVLVWFSIVEGSIRVYNVDEITSAQYEGEECRLEGGKIAVIESRANPMRFTVAAEKDSDASGMTVQIVSDRLPPDNFREGIPVSLRGVYDRPAGVFNATEITTACPSKYQGETKKSSGNGYSQKVGEIPVESRQGP